MANRYISATATSGDGTEGNPWSVAQFNTGCAYGDVCRFRGGIYRTLLNPTPSGTGSDSNRLICQAYAGEVPIWDGSRLAAALSVAVPDPWNDVPAETGWNPVTLSHADAGTNVYRKPMPDTIFGVFADKFQDDEGDAGIYTAGKFAVLWDMGIDNTDYTSPISGPSGSTFNPNLRIHDGNINAGGLSGRTHSDIQRSTFGADLAAHGPEAQYRFSGGNLDIRLAPYNQDPRTTVPKSHRIYCQRGPGGAQIALTMTGKNYITFDGLRFYRWKQALELVNCTNITLQNCWLMYAWGTTTANGIDNCANFKVLNCRVHGGGSMMRHAGGLFLLSSSHGAEFRNSDLAFGAHDAIVVRTSNNGFIVNNDFHDTAGSQLQFRRSPGSNNWHIERNRMHTGNKIADVTMHKTPHGAIQAASLTNSFIDRNIIYDQGVGIYFSAATGSDGVGCSGNKIRHNTFDNMEWYCMRTQAYSNAPGTLGNNHFGNNIFSNPGSGFYCVLYDTYGGASPLDGVTFHNNLFYKGSGNANQHVTLAGYSHSFAYAGVISGAPAAIAGSPNNNKTGNPSYTAIPAYTISGASPAADAGTTETPNYYDGAGFVGAAPDMGALEQGGVGDLTAPTITASSATPATGDVPLLVNFSVTASDPSTPLFYEWIWGDGTANGPTGSAAPSHTYNTAGTYQARLRVRDNAGNWTDPITWNIQVLSVPDAAVQLTVYGTRASSYVVGPPAQSPEMAYDGILGSVDASNYWAAGPMPQWNAADVRDAPGVRYRITRVDVSQVQWATRVYTLDIGVADVEDPQELDWVTVAPDVVTTAVEFTTFNFAETRGGWVRVRVKSLAGSASTYASLHEVRIWGKAVPAGQPGQEYAGVVWTDSLATTGTFAPAKVADDRDVTVGDPLSRWIAALPVDLLGDLQSLVPIGRLTVQPDGGFDGRTYAVVVATSADDTPTPTTWITRLTTQTSPGRETTLSFPAVTARHVRLAFSAASDGHGAASFWRAQVFAS